MSHSRLRQLKQNQSSSAEDSEELKENRFLHEKQFHETFGDYEREIQKIGHINARSIMESYARFMGIV